jgi:hypothetical protein
MNKLILLVEDSPSDELTVNQFGPDPSVSSP